MTTAHPTSRPFARIFAAAAIVVLAWPGAREARASAMPAADGQSFESNRPSLQRAQVDALPGCNFDGACLVVFGSQVRVNYRHTPLFAVGIPDATPAGWRLATALSPVDVDGAIGVDLVDDAGNADISIRFCPRSAPCAAGRYRSTEAYYRSARARGADTDHAPAAAVSPATACTPLAERRWGRHRAYRFSDTRPERDTLRTQGHPHSREFRETVLVPGRRGMLAVTYSLHVFRFPVQMDALRSVFLTLRPWEMLFEAKATAPPLSFRADGCAARGAGPAGRP